MSQQHLYLRLDSAKTGQINGVVTANSLDSVVASETMVNISSNFLNGIKQETLHKTHYYQGGVLFKYPTAPVGPSTFNFETMQWDQDNQLAWELVKRDREQLLKGSDWMVTKAVELGEPMPAGWAAYRQALRDLTLQVDPNNIVWPTAPQ